MGCLIFRDEVSFLKALWVVLKIQILSKWVANRQTFNQNLSLFMFPLSIPFIICNSEDWIFVPIVPAIYFL